MNNCSCSKNVISLPRILPSYVSWCACSTSQDILASRNAQVNVIEYIGSQFGQQSIGEILEENTDQPALLILLHVTSFCGGTWRSRCTGKDPTQLGCAGDHYSECPTGNPPDMFFRACTRSVLKRIEEVQKRGGSHIELKS